MSNSNMELNKVFAALLVAGIVASVTGFVAAHIVHSEPLKENAYKIEGAAEASEGGAPAAEAKPEPVLELIASADPARGQQVAKVCASCHNFEKGGPNGMGPNLYGVVGRPRGSHEGFDYSAGMKSKGGDWTYEDLNHFLWKPKSFVEGTKMTFAGVKKPEDRAAVIAWLRTLSDSPHPMPSAAEIAAEKAELAPEAAPDGKAAPEEAAGDKTGAPEGGEAKAAEDREPEDKREEEPAPAHEKAGK